MATTFHKTIPTVALSDFLKKASAVKSFSSFRGQSYKVIKIDNGEMFFLCLDTKSNEEWSMNLKEIYTTYIDLENFKNYDLITHSLVRGLIQHLKMLA